MKKYIMVLLVCLMSLSLMAQSYDLVVAKDGSGDYTTIQDAINAIRDYKPEGRQFILVKSGVYEEKVIVPSYKTNISLVGEDQQSTILVWHDHANMRTASGWGPATKNEARAAQVSLDDKEARKIGTFQSYTLRVDGLGFECENMTIVNDAMTYNNPNWMEDRQDNVGVGQAVAVHVEGDKTVFRNCRLLGFQDTLFTGNEGSRQIYYNCYIEGTVDFIFGPATCWFDRCEIHAIANGYLTAASTPADHPYGYVFNRCTVTADPKVTREYLGRPWRNHAAVIFSECELPACIAPEGWDNWRDTEREKTARFRENKCTGPGASLKKRAAWTRKLTNEEINNLQVRRVLFQTGGAWDSNFLPVDFYSLHFAFCDEFQEKGTPYVASTLEPETLSAQPENDVEPLVMRFDGVDCTTFVEYMSAAMLGRCDNPSPTDSIMKRYVQALRYYGGNRGNYATRKHYFSDWIADNEKQGLLTEITSTLPGAVKQKKMINFMSTHTGSYAQLAASPALTAEIKTIEQRLSGETTYYIPTKMIRRALKQLQDGDIVAFVTKVPGLDVSHVGFVWQRDSWHDEPHLLHASSKEERVTVSKQTILEYAASQKNCLGIRIIRLNAK